MGLMGFWAALPLGGLAEREFRPTGIGSIPHINVSFAGSPKII